MYLGYIDDEILAETGWFGTILFDGITGRGSSDDGGVMDGG